MKSPDCCVKDKPHKLAGVVDSVTCQVKKESTKINNTQAGATKASQFSPRWQTCVCVYSPGGSGGGGVTGIGWLDAGFGARDGGGGAGGGPMPYDPSTAGVLETVGNGAGGFGATGGGAKDGA